MPGLLFAFVIVLFGACIHHDPAIGAFIIMGVLLVPMLLITIVMSIYMKITEPARKAAEEAAWKKKYPNTKSFDEFMKERFNEDNG